MLRPSVIAAALALAVGAVAEAATSLTVNAVAPTRESFSAKLVFDGSTTAAFVVDESPNAETHYYAEVFIFIDNAFTMAFGSPPAADRFNLIRGKDANLPGSQPPMLLLLRMGHLTVTAQGITRLDNGAIVGTQAVSLSIGQWQRLRLDWQASSAPGANDGYIRIRKGVGPVKEVAALDNDTLRIDRVEVGGAGGVDPTTTGQIAFDDFSSFRTTPADWP